MKSLIRTTPCGDTIFCDDIRQEITGKTIIIGVYAGSMIVDAVFPTKVSLAMRIVYQEHAGESDEPLELLIYAPGNRDDEPFFRTGIPHEFRGVAPQQFNGVSIRDILREQESAEEDDHILTTAMHFQLSDIPVPKAGRIRVRIKRGDTYVRLGSLAVLPMSMFRPQPPVPPEAG